LEEDPSQENTQNNTLNNNQAQRDTLMTLNPNATQGQFIEDDLEDIHHPMAIHNQSLMESKHSKTKEQRTSDSNAKDLNLDIKNTINQSLTSSPRKSAKDQMTSKKAETYRDSMGTHITNSSKNKVSSIVQVAKKIRREVDSVNRTSVGLDRINEFNRTGAVPQRTRNNSVEQVDQNSRAQETILKNNMSKQSRLKSHSPS